MSASFRVSLVINTHNQPDYLNRVMRAVERQTKNPDEVLLADDGSEPETADVVKHWGGQLKFRCEHVWQQNEGFRRARILNQAIVRSRGDYLVFLDGDTVPHPKFVADHSALAHAGAFVQGHRALIEREAATVFGTGDFRSDRRQALWQGQIRGIKHAFHWPVPWKRFRRDLEGVRGCNLAIWRKDLMSVNGYNEAYVGWGREDSDLGARLMHAGVRRLDVRGWMLCYHLWHPPANRTGLPGNDGLLEKTKREKSVRCALGLDQYLRPTE